MIEIVDQKALDILIKLIQHDTKICGGVSSCFTNKKEQDNLIHHMRTHMAVPDKHIFEVWDLLESHSNKVLSKIEKAHVKYLYEECNTFLVEEAKRLSEEQDK